jgi:uncharacterized protein
MKLVLSNERSSNKWQYFWSEVYFLFIGTLLGILLFSSIAIAFTILGNLKILEIHLPTWDSLSDIFKLFQPAAREELFVRLMFFSWLYKKWNFHVASFISSLLFVVLHLLNPGANAASSLGIFGAGMLLSAILANYGSFGLNIGTHWGWNFAQGILWGLPISGIMTYSKNSILNSEIQSDQILTGGAFGLEASPLAILVIAAIVIFYYKKIVFIEKTSQTNLVLLMESKM